MMSDDAKIVADARKKGGIAAARLSVRQLWELL